MIYEDLDEYNYKPEVIKLFENIVKSSKNDSIGTSVSKKLNNLLLSNAGDPSEVVSLGIQLYFFVKDVNKINMIPSSIKSNIDVDAFILNCGDIGLMELMIRVGQFENNAFTSKHVSRGMFHDLIDWYYENITDCKCDNFTNDQMRKQFLVGFKRWYDNDTVLHKLVTMVTSENKYNEKLEKPYSKKRKILFKYNNGSIYEDDTFNYGLETFHGYDETKKLCITKKEYFSKNWTLDQAFTELSREFFQQFEDYKSENNLVNVDQFDPIDKYLYCCEVGQSNWGKYKPKSKNNNLEIGEGIGNFFEVNEKDTIVTNETKPIKNLQKPLSRKELKERLRVEEDKRTEELILTKQVPAM